MERPPAWPLESNRAFNGLLEGVYARMNDMNAAINDANRDRAASASQTTSRYARQIRYAPIGASGQHSINESRVAIVGMGALGCVIASHLVRSGVGHVRIIDRDIVEWSNLQRQMLYTERDVQQLLPKVEAAAVHLREINSSIVIEPIVADVTPLNAEQLLSNMQLIIDGTDNFSIRYLLNDISVKHNIPWIYGGAVGASGMTMTIMPGDSPCYRCLFPEPPAPGMTDTCETAGVLSPIIDIIASVQASEAIKLLSGNEQALHRTLFQVDLWNHAWMPVGLAGARKNECPTCGQHHYPFLEENGAETAAATLCGRHTVQITPGKPANLDLEQLKLRLAPAGRTTYNRYLLRVELPEGLTFVLFSDGRALVQGTDELLKAKSVYAELLGV